MYVPDTITTLMSWVCVWSGAANPAGNLKNAPYAPFAWLPHRSAILTPGAPVGSRSVHFKSLAGMTTSRLAAPFGALLAFVSPDPCAKTGAARANVITNARTFLALIDPSPLVDASCPDLTPVFRSAIFRGAGHHPACRETLLSGYCLSKTPVFATLLPFESVPLVVTVRLLPSAATAIRPVT